MYAIIIAVIKKVIKFACSLLDAGIFLAFVFAAEFFLSIGWLVYSFLIILSSDNSQHIVLTLLMPKRTHMEFIDEGFPVLEQTIKEWLCDVFACE